MGRPTTKEEMLAAASERFSALWTLIDAMSEESLNTDFDFSQDVKKKEAHWRRDKNLRDILIHLYEWHQLLLKWVELNMAGYKSSFLPQPFTWKTYGDMNVEFWKKHQQTPLEDARHMLKSSHASVMALAENLSNEELFTKQYFDWTGTTTVGSYCVSALSSHYDWAIKKLKAHCKKFS